MGCESEIWPIVSEQTTNSSPVTPELWKIKRSTPPELRSKIVTFAKEFQMRFSLKDEHEIFVREQIASSLMTGSLSLFDVCTKANRTTDKKLMSDKCTVKDAYKVFRINNVDRKRSQYYTVDRWKTSEWIGLTKNFIWEKWIVLFKNKLLKLFP